VGRSALFDDELPLADRLLKALKIPIEQVIGDGDPVRAMRRSRSVASASDFIRSYSSGGKKAPSRPYSRQICSSMERRS
jgi:hypothetical protein